MSRLVNLYPRAWRARYGDELEELATARPLGLGGAVDLMLGALDAHRHPELVDPALPATPFSEPVSRQRYEDLRVARRLGFGAVAGIVPLIIAPILGLNGPIMVDGDGAYRDGAAAIPFLVAAMVLLAGGLAGQLIRLGAGHHIARAGAITALICGPLWAIGPWILPLGVLTLIGLAVFSLMGWWARLLSAPVATAILGALLVCVGVLGVGILQHVDRLRGAEYFALAMIALSPILLAVGGTLYRLPDVHDGQATAIDSVGGGSSA